MMSILFDFFVLGGGYVLLFGAIPLREKHRPPREEGWESERTAGQRDVSKVKKIGNHKSAEKVAADSC
jgi:hypothetical protein